MARAISGSDSFGSCSIRPKRRSKPRSQANSHAAADVVSDGGGRDLPSLDHLHDVSPRPLNDAWRVRQGAW